MIDLHKITPLAVRDGLEGVFIPDVEEGNGLVIMQSTGLNDKNGKEIFEGDVVRDQEGCGVVEWVDATAAFCVKVENCDHQFYGWNKLDTSRPTQLQETEVIGNIYESPSLLPSP